jgi:dTDP-4-amino-4,6-dideoxygalactose transaminase
MDSLRPNGEDSLMIPVANPYKQYAAYKKEIDEAIERVLNKGHYILGEEVQAFEQEFSRYIGVKNAIGTGSGTEAIHLALAACGVGDGDEVITIAHTAVATVAAIELAGAVPVFVDIEREFYTLDPSRVLRAITKKTKAIIPVHIYGQPADMKPLMEIAKKNNIRVIEDCAQAHGATYYGQRVGSFGDMGCFSFYPTKNLGAVGDAGMVVTDNETLAQRASLLREYGWSERYISSIRGWNTRIDEMQAAILRIKLRHLDNDNAKRAKIAMFYNKSLEPLDIVLPGCRENATHVYHLYVVRSPRREELLDFLPRRGVAASIHYPIPIHLQPAYRGRIQGSNELPETERAALQVLSLPIFPELSEEEARVVIDVITENEDKHDRGC